MSSKDLDLYDLTLPPELADLPEEVRTLPDLVYRGLEQYHAGQTAYLGSFAQYAVSEPSEIQWALRPDAPDQSSSSSDWDALAEEGRLVPELCLQDPQQIALIQGSVDVLQSFFRAVRRAGIREEM